MIEQLLRGFTKNNYICGMAKENYERISDGKVVTMQSGLTSQELNKLGLQKVGAKREVKVSDLGSIQQLVDENKSLTEKVVELEALTLELTCKSQDLELENANLLERIDKLGFKEKTSKK